MLSLLACKCVLVVTTDSQCDAGTVMDISWGQQGIEAARLVQRYAFLSTTFRPRDRHHFGSPGTCPVRWRGTWHGTNSHPLPSQVLHVTLCQLPLCRLPISKVSALAAGTNSLNARKHVASLELGCGSPSPERGFNSARWLGTSNHACSYDIVASVCEELREARST